MTRVGYTNFGESYESALRVTCNVLGYSVRSVHSTRDKEPTQNLRRSPLYHSASVGRHYDPNPSVDTTGEVEKVYLFETEAIGVLPYFPTGTYKRRRTTVLPDEEETVYFRTSLYVSDT